MKPLVKPARGAAEDAVQQQDACDGERDIEHAFQEERKHAMLLLFQEYARQQRHQEHEPYHPYRSAVERLVLSYHLTHVDADEEDRHAAPENLQMSYSLMYRGDILYQDAPHDHHHRQPAVDRMALDEFHVGRGKEIEHHRSRDVPEVELIMQPEPP